MIYSFLLILAIIDYIFMSYNYIHVHCIYMCTLYTMYMHMFFEFIITFILSFSDHPCECHYHSKNESFKFYNPPYFAKKKKKIKLKIFYKLLPHTSFKHWVLFQNTVIRHYLDWFSRGVLFTSISHEFYSYVQSLFSIWAQ